jgi:DNA-binding response OmpR family regulator
MILVAGDDWRLGQTFAEILDRQEGWSATWVGGLAALLVALDTERPDLIILVVRMPDPDGIAVYRLLRVRWGLGQVPVLFATAFPERVREARLDGPHAILEKPYGAPTLVARAAAMLAV